MKVCYQHVRAYETKDGSEARALMHPAVHGNVKQSMAEVVVPVAAETKLHRHKITEEIYHVIQGEGIMTLGGATFNVSAADTVCIPPGSSHKLQNTGSEPLRLLCCCAPPYSNEDTELLE